jgi:tetratricopeptide (TPR) repeat protein
MSKKKNSSRHDPRPSIPRQLLEGLHESDDLMKRKRWNEARNLLEELNDDYPGQPYVLTNLVNTYYELKDMAGYQRACERLLKADDSDPDIRIGLAGAYLSNGFPMLALRAFREFLHRNPDHARASEIRSTVTMLEQGQKDILEEMGLEGAEGQRLAELHEEVQSCLGQGEYAQARRLAEELLRRRPNLAPAFLQSDAGVCGRWPALGCHCHRPTCPGLCAGQYSCSVEYHSLPVFEWPPGRGSTLRGAADGL